MPCFWCLPALRGCWCSPFQGAEVSFHTNALRILGSASGPKVASTASSGLWPFWSHSKWMLQLLKQHEVPGHFPPGVKDKKPAVISHSSHQPPPQWLLNCFSPCNAFLTGDFSFLFWAKTQASETFFSASYFQAITPTWKAVLHGLLQALLLSFFPCFWMSLYFLLLFVRYAQASTFAPFFFSTPSLGTGWGHLRDCSSQ